MDFAIEKNIPMTEVRGRPPKYPFGAMEIGESFSISKEAAENVRAAASYYGKRNDLKFAVRQHGDGYRVWRTA